MPVKCLTFSAVAAVASLAFAGAVFAQGHTNAYNGNDAGYTGANRTGTSNRPEPQNRSASQADGGSDYNAAQNDNEGLDNQNSGRAQAGARHVMTRAEVVRDLSQAGFKNVQVVESAFQVRANDRNGNTVYMTITPSSIAMAEFQGPDNSSGNRQNQDHRAMGGGAAEQK